MYDSYPLQNHRRKFSFQLTLFDIFAGLYIAHKLIPAVGYYMPSIVYLGIFCFLLIYAVKNTVMQRHTWQLLPLLSIPLLTCIRYVVKGNIGGVPLYVYSEAQTLMFGIIAFYILESREQESPKKWLNFIIACYVFTAITTIVGCTRFPLAARYLASVSSTTDGLYILYTKNNIGGFTFIYEMTLLTPLICYLLKEKKVNRLLGIGILTLFGATIIVSEYTTPLLLFAITLILMLMGRMTRKKLAVIFLIVLALLIFGTQWIANIFEKLAEMVGSESVSARFEYLAQTISGETVSDTMESGDRFSLYEESWNAFVDSLGLGGWGRLPIGGHNFVLDTAGNYGILGIAGLVIMYRYIYRTYLQPYRKQRLFGYTYYVMVASLILAAINPKPFLFTLIAIIPLFSEVYQAEEIGEKNEITVDRQ